MAIGQSIARSSQDLFWLRLTGYSEHCLLPPLSGEVFEDLEACSRRLHGYALAKRTLAAFY
jgi:hypothetical protein